MAKVLRLYNSYYRCLREAKLGNGHLVEVPQNNSNAKQASLYICGPTVYSESHLGHALTYIRADLFRRVLKSIFDIRLTTVINITDIDDKILAKADEEVAQYRNVTTNPSSHHFQAISEKYFKSFIDEMNFVRVKPPDLVIKVSKQVPLIIRFIKQLEKSGHAYEASNGDIYFKVSSVSDYQGRVDERLQTKSQTETVKRDLRDFALWKAAKPGEPVWLYESDTTGRTLPGRPGWHVQCSAICSAIFGNQLDFHYGGKDLIFPHHYNEQACCNAFHNLDTSNNFHVWSQNWLHSGHLVMRDEKMSKSLGNVVGIRSFIGDTSVNALRLLCVESHYRADVNYNNELLSNMKSLEHRISAFVSYTNDLLRQVSDSTLETLPGDNLSLETEISKVREQILEGICDDLDLSKGLYSILDLSKMVYNIGFENLRPRDIVAIWHILVDWSSMCGLDYSSTRETFKDQALLDLVRTFRQDVRNLVMGEMRQKKKAGLETDDHLLRSLLASCDDIRGRMDELGFIIRDEKT